MGSRGGVGFTQGFSGGQCFPGQSQGGSAGVPAAPRSPPQLCLWLLALWSLTWDLMALAVSLLSK